MLLELSRVKLIHENSESFVGTVACILCRIDFQHPCRGLSLGRRCCTGCCCRCFQFCCILCRLPPPASPSCHTPCSMLGLCVQMRNLHKKKQTRTQWRLCLPLLLDKQRACTVNRQAQDTRVCEHPKQRWSPCQQGRQPAAAMSISPSLALFGPVGRSTGILRQLESESAAGGVVVRWDMALAVWWALETTLNSSLLLSGACRTSCTTRESFAAVRTHRSTRELEPPGARPLHH